MRYLRNGDSAFAVEGRWTGVLLVGVLPSRPQESAEAEALRCWDQEGTTRLATMRDVWCRSRTSGDGRQAASLLFAGVLPRCREYGRSRWSQAAADRGNIDQCSGLRLAVRRTRSPDVQPQGLCRPTSGRDGRAYWPTVTGQRERPSSQRCSQRQPRREPGAVGPHPAAGTTRGGSARVGTLDHPDIRADR
jgi:hypothetical protein